MLLAITLVSASVHIFAAEYMQEDPHLPRFMIYLTLFTFFIIIIVTAENYLQLFLA
jgi:NADH:ubiquinone oxidoreductase subunit 5 (subunit L)/multisubunit Na+/H+ antiporter MnhA subunit